MIQTFEFKIIRELKGKANISCGDIYCNNTSKQNYIPKYSKFHLLVRVIMRHDHVPAVGNAALKES